MTKVSRNSDRNGLTDLLFLLGSGIVWLIKHTLLVIVFFGLFMPLALIMRLLGIDPMHRKFNPSATSYLSKSKIRSKAHMDNPF